ncbi:hypothetical protein HE1_00207 [Holospora elegans E1]|uniref:Uncharacterized protein n=1 Tax=Holospora elegans E1 TaxID=1427503 RepID=A0A023DYA1_9PROT|nr:hypothetical protein [Holospora elegans]GAJ45890.1 hypothetical protein HE1_00207 [Holospora elegans E1]
MKKYVLILWLFSIRAYSFDFSKVNPTAWPQSISGTPLSGAINSPLSSQFLKEKVETLSPTASFVSNDSNDISKISKNSSNAVNKIIDYSAKNAPPIINKASDTIHNILDVSSNKIDKIIDKISDESTKPASEPPVQNVLTPLKITAYHL